METLADKIKLCQIVLSNVTVSYIMSFLYSWFYLYFPPIQALQIHNMDQEGKMNHHFIALLLTELLRISNPKAPSTVFCQWCFLKLGSLQLLYSHWSTNDPGCDSQQIWYKTNCKKGMLIRICCCVVSCTQILYN